MAAEDIRKYHEGKKDTEEISREPGAIFRGQLNSSGSSSGSYDESVALTDGTHLGKAVIGKFFHDIFYEYGAMS